MQDRSRPGHIQCWSPVSGAFLGEVAITRPEDVPGIVARARQAQTAWVKTTFEERRHVLRVLNKCLLAHRDEICKLSCMDTGKTRTLSIVGISFFFFVLSLISTQTCSNNSMKRPINGTANICVVSCRARGHSR